ncbi:MAG: SurA N-terminal domain-containing protein, partial [Alphaproteobacteria bacterium]|nr:SurA N-terminal domain-containing protein [Alphaproteobacteria bacterium]
MLKKLCTALMLIAATTMADAASVVASVGGEPITDTDITARVKLMARQGNTATDNRRQALQSIIDDNIKLNYAKNFNAVPSDDDIKAELKRMNLGELSASEREMAMNAARAEIAWQIVVARTILPTISANEEDIAAERATLAREHGLPIEMTIVRLIDIPEDIAKKLSKPKSCDAAMKMAEKLGGVPQKFTALQYEL